VGRLGDHQAYDRGPFGRAGDPGRELPAELRQRGLHVGDLAQRPVQELAEGGRLRGRGLAHRGERWLDLTGLALLAPGLALTLYGLSTRTARLPLLATGLVLLAAFTVQALRSHEVAPLLNLRLFANRPFTAATALNFLSRLSIFGVMILLPLYYQQVRGHSALTAGLLLAPQSLGTMIALPYVGRLTDRLGARPVVLAGIAATTLSALAFTQVGAHTGGVILGGVLLIWGMGVAAVAVPVSAAAYEGLEPTEIPSATSTITTIQTVGASVGAAVLAAILQSRLSHHHGTPATAFADTFWWVLGFTALTLVPAMFLPLRRPQPGA
jgi:predicted MFS family arabinose efflux permease